MPVEEKYEGPLGRRMARRNKGAERELAVGRVRRLMTLAQAASPEDSVRADRYVGLARRIAMRYQVSLPRELRRRVCRGCDGLLVPGRSARVRVAHGRVTVTCLRCDTVKRYPYTRPKKTVAPPTTKVTA